MGRTIWSVPLAPWRFPEREHFFVTDVHADADALLRSLEATGGVERYGSYDEIRLTARGRDAVFVMGGDYFDKGPSNLRLLRVLQRLVESDAEVVLLAGNHDIRTLLGVAFAEESDPTVAHLFVRMGPKVVPLLCEVYEHYVAPAGGVTGSDDDRIADNLLPPESWWDDFPPLVRDMIPPARLAKELRRVRQKCGELRAALERAGMTMGMVAATLRACREQFLERGGDYAWLHERMQIVHRAGSFLFCHAGIDDVVAQALSTHGVDAINVWFRELLESDPFELYNGPLGNLFRTKYRDQDFPFTEIGAECLRRCGVFGVVHGHKSHVTGQQLEMRHGIAHFECDTSLDRNTRLKCGLAGVGMSATIIGYDCVRAISNDSASERVLDTAPAE